MTALGIRVAGAASLTQTQPLQARIAQWSSAA
jgi:hypothetical protein